MDAGLEPGELPGPVRERAQSKTRRQVKRATADRSASVPRVEDDIAVQQAEHSFVTWRSPFLGAADTEATPMLGAGVRAAKLATTAMATIRVIF